MKGQSEDQQSLLGGGGKDPGMSTNTVGGEGIGGSSRRMSTFNSSGEPGRQSEGGSSDQDNEESSGTSRFQLFMKSRLFVVGELWQATPFSARILSIPAILLAIALVLVSLAVGSEIEAEHAHLRYFPELIDKFTLVMERVLQEDIASQNYIHYSTIPFYKASLDTSRSELDTAIENVFNFYKTHQDDLQISENEDHTDPTVSSEIQFDQLYELRARILPSPLVSSSVCSKLYQGILLRMADLLKRFSIYANSGSGAGREVSLWITNLLILHTMEVAADADHLLHLPATTATAERAHDIGLVLEENRVNAFASQILSIFLETADYNEYNRKLSAARIDAVFDRLDHDLLLTVDLPSTWTTATEYSGFQNLTRGMLDKDLEQVRTFRAAIGIPSVVNTQIGLRVMLGLLVTFLVCVLGYLTFDRLTDVESAYQLKASHTIREAISRVREYAISFETFSLNPPPPPDGMKGTPTAEIERRLSQCLASLRSLAPFLPPLLLPQRSYDTAVEIQRLRRIEKGQLSVQRAERGQIPSADLHMLTPKDIDNRKSATKMEDVTDLMMEDTLAVCLTIDLSQLHQVATNSKSSMFTSKAYPEVVSIVEEKVLNTGGVLTSVVMDYATAIWHGPNALTDYSLVAAQTASAITKELNALRRGSAQLSSVFKVRLSVTGGPVTMGIFGNDDFKTLQVFGPAVMLGSTIAQVNQHHATMMLCDEQVRAIVEKTYPCKPIELLLNGDVIYEVVHPQRGREEDMESRLSVYNRAFGLFRQKYNREALKAFRGYTKQYGYDRSVERIQSLITGE